ncbi:MAG: DinB family protein [Ignavibacteriaceae bacterium]|jgi:ribosomal protein L29
MKKSNLSLERDFLKDILEEAYFKKAWHGPNLHSALNGVTADDALKRPSKGRNNIYEITIHSAYWVYRVINRIRKNPGLKFPLKGNNWFESPKTLTNTEWKKIKKLLNELHKELFNLISELSSREFKSKTEKEKQIISRLLVGISMHDVYHAGQIQLIKKLIKR